MKCHCSQKILPRDAINVQREGLCDGWDVGDSLLPVKKVLHEARQQRDAPQQITDRLITSVYKHGYLPMTFVFLCSS